MSHLEFYVRSMGRLSQPAFLERVNTPVLVESTSSKDLMQEGERAFRTEYVSLNDALSARAQGPAQREVILVKKREGALFSGHIGVGRTPNLDICLARHGISKFHAYFSCTDAGQYQLTDKDSKNGTYVNGTKLSPGVAANLSNNVEVRFAAHVFRFLTPEDFYTLIHGMAA
jgi:FHA domain